MPLKRRTRAKGQTKQKSSKSRESSSEDTDRCTAEEIVNRLAKKYLLKSSTDTEQSDQKENERASTRVADPYDADLETSEVDTAASVETASDMEYLEAQPSPRILSPSRQANVAPLLSVSSKHESSRQSSSKFLSTRRQHESRRPSATTPQKSATAQEKHSFQGDSGLFISPLSNIPRRHLPKMNASDTSTPTSACGDIRSDLNDSCFGFESLVAPDPLAPISPVDPISPTGQAARSRSALSDVSLTRDSSASTSFRVGPATDCGPPKRKVSATLDLTSLVQEQPQPVKKLKKKLKPDTAKLSKAQEWAAKMAEEFQDIEMHELTIEG
ncbi:uncharacterized protein LOC110989929 [Acanthaster planci]|uniref:Uncharacterized protein LOC110989929 n=1 Tax=Acanthaster planci TaxID=133434 RepID=A0A8B7ZZ05_ACAPL|nr:uncharacterized protein LOC110989929 [Acanthaster planci]